MLDTRLLFAAGYTCGRAPHGIFVDESPSDEDWTLTVAAKRPLRVEEPHPVMPHSARRGSGCTTKSVTLSGDSRQGGGEMSATAGWSDGHALGTAAAQRLAGYDPAAVGQIGPGLTDAEFDRIERTYEFTFADDHRALLAAGLPTNAGIVREDGVLYTHEQPWPDWRNGDPAHLRAMLTWPIERVLLDVEHWHWRPSWGARPASVTEAVRTARNRLSLAPTMVPVYAHRFLPAGRGTWGHPVLSMWGTDIICYGSDLAQYITREFGSKTDRDIAPEGNVTVEVWRDYVD